jgi:methionyl-tRNA formyltransferase
MSLRIVFMGTPDFAVPTLVEIVGRGHEVVAV